MTPTASRPGRRSVLVAAAATAASVPLSGTMSPAAARTAGLFRLFAPTGLYPVGVASAFVPDPARPEPVTQGVRTLPVRVWYPARRAGSARAGYFSPALQPLFEAGYGVPAGTFAAHTHATTGAPPRRPRGVLLLSGGLGLPAAFQSTHAVDLASHGWVVAGFDHPHDTFFAEQPGGAVVQRDLPETPAGGREAFAARMLDTQALLARLDQVLPGCRGLPIGMFGHSIGGATAVESAYRFEAVRAAVDLDGTPRGEVVAAGTAKPVGFMLSNIRDSLPPGQVDEELETLLTHLRGPHPLVKQGSIGHDGFTDLATFHPQALAADPAVAAALAGPHLIDVETLTEARTAVTGQRAFLRGFFDRYLRR